MWHYNGNIKNQNTTKWIYNCPNFAQWFENFKDPENSHSNLFRKINQITNYQRFAVNLNESNEIITKYCTSLMTRQEMIEIEQTEHLLSFENELKVVDLRMWKQIQAEKLKGT